MVKKSTADDTKDQQLKQNMAALIRTTMQSPEKQGAGDRDSFMGENILHWLEAPPSKKTVVWAHKSHIQKKEEAFSIMGHLLKENLGADYLSVGFMFYEGHFRGGGEEWI